MSKSELGEVLDAQYAHLGRISRLERLTFDFTVCNELFLLNTDSGRYIIKAMTAAQAFFGSSDTQKRLELVGEVTDHLFRAKHQVEELIRGGNNRFVQESNAKLIRVYRYIENRPYNGSQQDQVKAADALQKLHTTGHAELEERLIEQLSGIKVAYPIWDTILKLEEIFEFVQECSKNDSEFANILSHWSQLEEAVACLKDYPETSSEQSKVIVHTDLHPRNILFCPSTGECTIIDFDSLMLDGPFRDLGFSILRFVDRQLVGDELEAAILNWAKAYTIDVSSEFWSNLIMEMILIEAEKAIRILYRYQTTNTYPQFLPNVSGLHLANIVRLLPMIQRKNL